MTRRQAVKEINRITKQYDKVFNKLLLCKPGTPRHSKLLQEENRLNNATEQIRYQSGLLGFQCPIFRKDTAFCDTCSGYFVKRLVGRTEKNNHPRFFNIEVSENYAKKVSCSQLCPNKFIKQEEEEL